MRLTELEVASQKPFSYPSKGMNLSKPHLTLPSKILAIKLRALGDTVIMTAALNELQSHFPQAEIHALVTNSWTSILNGLTSVQKIWSYERRKEPIARARGLARLAYTLRKEKFDCVVNFHASPSSAALSFATGAPLRSIHFHGHKDQNRYSTVTIPGKGVLKPIIERDMDTLRALGLHIPAGRMPKISLQYSEIQEAKSYLQKLGFNQPLMTINLGASRPTKAWPIDRYASLAIEWCRKEKGGVLAFSGPTETEESHLFLKSVNNLLSLEIASQKDRSEIRNRITATSELPTRFLAAILSQASVHVGNDSGPKHLAVSVNTPTVTLFGPEHPMEWHPYPLHQHPYFFIEELSCRRDADPGMPPWCALQTCTVEEHKCLKGIGVDSVLAKAIKVANRRANF